MDNNENNNSLIKIYIKGNDLALVGTIPEPILQFEHKKFQNYTSFYPRNYFNIIDSLEQNHIPYWTAVTYDFSFNLDLKQNYQLYDFQKEAIESWNKNQGQGTMILPTGSGKTIIALHSIAVKKITTLIVVPTLALIDQWKNRIRSFLGISYEDIGEFGGGKQDIKQITIITYESAYLYTRRLRLLFGLLILDEAHHLTNSNYTLIADGYISPFRLALTATLNTSEKSYNHLMQKGFGPIIYQKIPADLQKEKILSDFRIVTKKVPVENLDEYKELILELQNYLKKIRPSSKYSIFQQLIFRVNRDPDAHTALQAYRKARTLAFSSKNKLQTLEELLQIHDTEKMIIFSDMVHFCEEISRTFFIPCITHRTIPEERRWLLDYYKRVPNAKIVASKILDEGIDFPDAKIAVIMISSSSTRQFIQRLGRILRRHPEKEEAILYEIVSEDTLEERLAKKRKKF